MKWDHEYKLIVRPEQDGNLGYGDSAAETFRYYHLLKVRESFGISNGGLPYQTQKDVEESLSHIEAVTTKVLFQRAPGWKLPSTWPQPPHRDFPQDQTTPIICALGAWGMHDVINEYVKGLGSYFQNGQPIWGDFRAVVRRATNQRSNNFLDAQIWPTVLNRCGMVPFWDNGTRTLEWHSSKKVQDIVNLIHWFAQCEYRGVTWQSERAKQFLKTHAWKPGIMGQLRIYYDWDTEMQDFYQPVIEKIFL